MATPVTDPALLEELEKGAGASTPVPVDPALAQQLDTPVAIDKLSAMGPPPVGHGTAIVKGAEQALSGGFGDEFAGIRRANAGSPLGRALSSLVPFIGPVLQPTTEDLVAEHEAETNGTSRGYAEDYRAARDADRAEQHAAARDHMPTYIGSQIATGLLMGARGGGSVPRTTLGKLGAGMKTGAKAGSLYGLGGSEADGPLGMMADAGVGALEGSGVGLAGATIGMGGSRLARWLAGKVRGEPVPAPPPTPGGVGAEVVTPSPQKPGMIRDALESTIKPTPEAELLVKEGVPLTVGQLNPRSVVGQVEEASKSLRGVGASIAAQRQAGLSGWQRLLFRKALPPGMKDVPQGSASEALDAMYQGFEPAYAKVKGEAIYPAIHNGGKGVPLQTFGKSVGAFDEVVSSPDVLADDATRAIAKRFLDNQLSRLPAREGAVGRVSVEDVLAMRSAIRKAASLARKQQKFDLAEILDGANDATTQALESQLAPEAMQALRSTDAQYAAYKVLEDAVSRAGDAPTGFTPSQFEAAVKASMDRGRFARGGGGELRKLSQAGRTVFESVSEPTGARLLTVGPLGEWFTGPLVFGANRSPPAMPSTPGAGAGTNPLLSQKLAELAALVTGLRQRGGTLSLPPAAADENAAP